MKYQIEIERADNGWVLRRAATDPDDDRGTTTVFAEDDEAAAVGYDDGEKAAWASLLRALTDDIGPSHNRYGRREIHVDLRPGSKLEVEDDVQWFLSEVVGLEGDNLTDTTKWMAERIAFVTATLLSPAEQAGAD